MNPVPYLTFITIILAVLHIRADFVKNYALIYFLKPATIVLMIVIVFFKNISTSELYKNLILIGLLFSLLGDIFLMLKIVQFKNGLASFLVAHIFYFFAFVSVTGLNSHPLIFVPILIYFSFLLKKLLPYTFNLKIPIIIYSFVLMMNLWQSSSRFYFDYSESSLFAFSGTLLFVISDSLLAYNKFVTKIKKAQFYILGTYYLSQLLIVYSV